MLRPSHATLPCAYLLNYGTRRTLKTKNFEGRGLPHFLPIRFLTVCRICISPKHKISRTAYKILDDRSHVLHLPTRKRCQRILEGRYDERQEGLWMQFTGNTMQKKRVVRSWATRRVDQAVTEALRTKGFNRNGKRLAHPAASTLTQSESKGSPVGLALEHSPEVLVGTVEVLILQNCIETSFTEVQRQAGLMVDRILEICGRYPVFHAPIDSRHQG